MNRHPYIGRTKDDPSLRHIVGGSLTGWIFADAVSQVRCPKCGSDRGYLCETPMGRKSRYPHNERVNEWVSEWKMAHQQQQGAA